ncbi:MAG: ABC transporter substrate-binding protein [Candidatus Sedimenticola sp. (ex Thyasira tokunagai)]
MATFSLSVAAAEQKTATNRAQQIARGMDDDSLLFLSTQLTPVHEADTMRRVILKEFPGKVDFQPYDNAAVFRKLALAKGDGKLKPDLLGVLHGDLRHLYLEGGLTPVDATELFSMRSFIPDFVELGKLGSGRQLYIPWMQATYIMAANRKALRYLPKGASIESLSYEQLQSWALNMERATGTAKLGFPAGPKGLMHRFFQGYLYPSFTGSTLSRFRSPEAVKMWSDFKALWSHVNPSSVTYNGMDEPLLSEEVWVTWDHTARLVSAFEQRPDDFVAFPAPIGPMGRGYMLVLAGLALPGNVEDASRSLELIDYMTRPDVQLTTLKRVGFFPVVDTEGAGDLPAGIASIERAVREQASSKDSLVALLPIGLGGEGKRFNLAYLRAFSRIVLREREMGVVLDRQATILREIVKTTQASCWLPDPSSSGPCPIE